MTGQFGRGRICLDSGTGTEIARCREDLAVVAVDNGNDVFHQVGFDQSGRLVPRKQIERLAPEASTIIVDCEERTRAARS